jgi:UDP-N-acetylmuramate--alanine ligase
VITNVEPDHLDYYASLDEIVEAFRCFARLVPPRGRVFVCAASASARAAVVGVEAPVETYGVEVEADWQARDVDPGGGEPSYTLVRRGKALGRIALRIPGRMNVEDSLAAAAVAATAGVPFARIRAGLASFTGARRRFQVVHDQGGIVVVDDYAHHPTEVAATIAAARDRYPDRRVVAVFQPHQHARTVHLRAGFVDALGRADEVLLTPIYGARESAEMPAAISSRDLVADLARAGKKASDAPGIEEAAALLAREARAGDVILCLGAGDIYKTSQGLRTHLLADATGAGALRRGPAQAREAVS